MKSRMLSLLLAALLLLSGCADAATAAPVGPSPTAAASPAPSPTPEPTPVPTAVPVMQPETEPCGATGGAAPYLLPDSGGAAMRVCWTGSRSGDVRVLYGPAGEDGALPDKPSAVEAVKKVLPDYAFSAYPVLYTASLPVEPGTRYAYGISEDGGAPDTVYHFRTNDAGRLSAVAVSDTHFPSMTYADRAATLENTLETALGAASESGGAIDMIIHTGDIMDQPEYSLNVLTDNVPMLRSFLFTPIVGNHDSLGSVREFFPMEGADKTTGNYWFVRGGVMFVGMQISVRYIEYHADYLRRVLEEAPEHNWTVVLIHYSMRSNGAHANDAAVVSFRRFLEPVMDELDVDLVISGHDHEYNRTVLLGSGAPEQPGEASRSSVVYKKPGERIYITLPSGSGLKYYDSGRAVDFAFAAEGLEHEPGYVLFDFTPEEIAISARSAETGEEIDAATLRRSEITVQEE